MGIFSYGMGKNSRQCLFGIFGYVENTLPGLGTRGAGSQSERASVRDVEKGL